MLLIPRSSAWTKFTSTEQDPDCEYLGGMAVCALTDGVTNQDIADSNPFWLIYGWDRAFKHYNFIITRVEGVDIGTTCYDLEKVLMAPTQQDAIDAANEYQGGEDDWIAETAKREVSYDRLKGVPGYIPNVALDDHESAQKYLSRFANNMMKKVLIADDDADVQEALSALLREVGFRLENMTKVWNGAAALSACRKKEYDLVLTDFMMPIKDGAAFVKELYSRPERYEIPKKLLMISSSDKSEIDTSPYEITLLRKQDFIGIQEALGSL